MESLKYTNTYNTVYGGNIRGYVHMLNIGMTVTFYKSAVLFVSGAKDMVKLQPIRFYWL